MPGGRGMILRLFSRCFVAVTVAMVCVLVSVDARAHAAGVSRGRYELRGSELVAQLVFANAELASALPDVDVNHDGAIDASELAHGGETIARRIVDPITVSADGKKCNTAFVGASLTEQDGVAIDLRSTCDARPKKLVVHCGFFDAFGAFHRHFAVVSIDDGHGERDVPPLLAGQTDITVDVGAASKSSSSTPESGAAFGSSIFSMLRLGVEHILTGYDHLTFLFGLILLGGRVRSLVWTLTAFTIAHSISLALAVLGVWAPSPAIVEPAIALSIAYVGVENFWRLKKSPNADDHARGRWKITFPFGLVHGFGFAGALQEIGLPRAKIPFALVTFNLGVEIGQLAILALVLPLVLRARKFETMRESGARVANAAIVVAGVFLFVQRVWF